MFIIILPLLINKLIKSNIIRKKECLVSYLYFSWDESLVPWVCEITAERASCAACKVSNEITTKSFLHLRGLCEESKFDTKYQGNDIVYSVYYSETRKLCLVVPLLEKIWPNWICPGQNKGKKRFSCIGIYFVWFNLVVFWPLFKWHITGFVLCFSSLPPLGL